MVATKQNLGSGHKAREANPSRVLVLEPTNPIYGKEVPEGFTHVVDRITGDAIPAEEAKWSRYSRTYLAYGHEVQVMPPKKAVPFVSHRDDPRITTCSCGRALIAGRVDECPCSADEHANKFRGRPTPQFSCRNVGIEFEMGNKSNSLSMAMRSVKSTIKVGGMNNSTWNFKGDGSISDLGGIEFVTPPMCGEAISREVSTFYAECAKHGVQMNHRKLGSHVHVDATDIWDAIFDKPTIVLRWAAIAVPLVRFCVHEDRANNQYCGGGFNFRGGPPTHNPKQAKYGGTTYPTIALRHNFHTLEFRIWPSTPVISRMLARVELSQRLVDWLSIVLESPCANEMLGSIERTLGILNSPAQASAYEYGARILEKRRKAGDVFRNTQRFADIFAKHNNISRESIDKARASGRPVPAKHMANYSKFLSSLEHANDERTGRQNCIINKYTTVNEGYNLCGYTIPQMNVIPAKALESVFEQIGMSPESSASLLAFFVRHRVGSKKDKSKNYVEPPTIKGIAPSNPVAGEPEAGIIGNSSLRSPRGGPAQLRRQRSEDDRKWDGDVGDCECYTCRPDLYNAAGEFVGEQTPDPEAVDTRPSLTVTIGDAQAAMVLDSVYIPSPHTTETTTGDQEPSV